ncbi:MAG: DUF1080 domain-containing protein [Acidobacteriia bacterium]|nr:DUF1080 domain-containing protein [Terriglobia bacterium]
MKQLWLLSIAAAALLGLAFAQKSANPFAGRWDITVLTSQAVYPDWLEVVEKDGALQCRYQPRAGSMVPIRDAKMEGSHLILAMSPASDKGPAATWDLTVSGDKLTGVMKRGETETGKLKGARAPELKRDPPKAWADPEPVFNGKDLTGWELANPGINHWVAKGGELVNEAKGANIKTTRKFDDFKLHVEYNCPDEGNSGVYLRGRYEVQVEYEKPGTNDAFHSMGAVYSMLAPAVELPKKPGQWETYDITLIGRWVTVVRDGVKTIDNQEIAGITGGALDANEGEPGPIFLQGDHTGGMKYRNITISVAKR